MGRTVKSRIVSSIDAFYVIQGIIIWHRWNMSQLSTPTPHKSCLSAHSFTLLGKQKDQPTKGNTVKLVTFSKKNVKNPNFLTFFQYLKNFIWNTCVLHSALESTQWASINMIEDFVLRHSHWNYPLLIPWEQTTSKIIKNWSSRITTRA